MLDVHRPYPGVALVVTAHGSVLFGAPADAFKATKAYCAKHQLPFPRVLVAPQQLIVDANPQFAPEFFLYDFLFVYGAAFKPNLEHERLELVLDKDQVEEDKRALAITLNGPSRADMAGYRDAADQPILDERTVNLLGSVSEHMAIKKGTRPRTLEESISTPTFDSHGHIKVLDGALDIQRTGRSSFHVRSEGSEADVDLRFDPPTVPFSTLPVPAEIPIPATFGLKPLGTRSGFDLSGPTTGFLFWINGRAVIYDGPVGTRYLLERQGINPSDVGAVILSHCHEDHMGAFVELLVGGSRPRVYTSEPIYRSMLVKVAHHFKMKEADVAGFVEYERVTPGKPVEAFGATFDFHYTVHSIPTIGMSVSLKENGRTHRVQISGDTMNHDGLDKMKQAGVIDEDTYRHMRELVPSSRVDDAIYLADVGEALIHGAPKDWQGNPNRVMYYHCPDDERTRGYGHEIASPGASQVIVESPRFHPAVPGRLLYALSFLDFKEPEWLAAFLHRGRTRKAQPGEILVDAGKPSRTLSVVVSGSVETVRSDGSVLAVLKPGELFGAIDLVDDERRYSATVRAATPVEVFEIDGALVQEYVESHDLQEMVLRTWTNRQHIDRARLFRTLDGPARSRVAALGTAETFEKGAEVFRQGTLAEDFFLLASGRVAIEVKGKVVREIAAEDPDNFFGEIAAIYPGRRRNATVRAATPVQVLRLGGMELRDLFEGEMAVRYALSVAIKERSQPQS